MEHTSHHNQVNTALTQLPDTYRGQVGATVLRLTHDSLVVAPQAYDELGVYSPVPPEQHSLVQIDTHNKVAGLMMAVSDYLVRAHEIIREKEEPPEVGLFGGRDGGLYRIARKLAIGDATAAKQRGEVEGAVSALQSMFAISLIDPGYHVKCDTEVRDGVGNGLAEEIVHAARDMHGVISLGDSKMHATSVPRVCKDVVPLLKVAARMDFDDQFQHTVSFGDSVGADPNGLLADCREKMSAEDELAMAKLEANVKHDAFAASYNALRAARKVLQNGWMETKRTDIAKIVSLGLQCSRQTAEPEVQVEVMAIVARMRARRSAGQYAGYRQNDSLIMPLDGAVIELALEGNRDAVMALVSSSPKETGIKSAFDDGMETNFDWPLEYWKYSPEQVAQFRAMVEGCATEKRTVLQKELALRGATDSIIEAIIGTFDDPDSMAEVPPEFWELYNTKTNPVVFRLIFGNDSYNQAKYATSVAELVASGLEYEDIAKSTIFVVDSLNNDEKSLYLEQVVNVLEKIKKGRVHDSGFLAEKRDVESLLTFLEPDKLYDYAVQLYGEPQGRDILNLGGILEGKKEYSQISHTLSAVFCNNLEYALGNGLSELIKDSGSLTELFVRFSAQGKVDVVDRHPYDLLVNLKAEGLLELGGETFKEMIVHDVLGKEDVLARFKAVQELSKQGLFEFTQDASIQFRVLSHILSAQDSVKEFQTVRQLADAGLFEIINTSGVLGSMSGRFLELCLRSENPQSSLARIKNLVNGGEKSLWWLNYQYADMLLGEVRDGAVSGNLVSAVAVGLPLSNRSEVLPEDNSFIKRFDEMTEDEKREVLLPEAIQAGYLNQASVPFNLLIPEARSTLLAHRLFTVIASSRSQEQMVRASERNLRLSQTDEPFRLGDQAHATSTTENLRSILLSGILCGETIGMSSTKDSYPYNVDTVEMSRAVMEGATFAEKVGALKNGGYGSIVLVINQTDASGEEDRISIGGNSEDHRLVFGGVPSTDISSIILRNAEDNTRDSVLDAVVEHGVYIQVYDTEGSLLLSHDLFLRLREDGNYVAVRPEIVDNSFKLEGTQVGSNEGAWYVMSTAGGSQRWYVKYGDQSSEKASHLWTEILADSLYRAVTPQITSETKAVLVGGRLARASREVVLAEQGMITNEARNEGFIMDCFLGNWDAVFNDANLVLSQDGHAMRIDTGNSLDYRARGERKTDDSFGNEVVEVEYGSDAKNLGAGMRQKYPGLTDDDVRNQVIELRDRLSEQNIDELVHNIRRPRAERLRIAETLKARRKYLIEKFLP